MNLVYFKLTPYIQNHLKWIKSSRKLREASSKTNPYIINHTSKPKGFNQRILIKWL